MELTNTTKLKSRPLIFFAHSLGGLLVKDVRSSVLVSSMECHTKLPQLMHICHTASSQARQAREDANLTRRMMDIERAEEYESLAALGNAAEAGALFFAGTPHKGSNKANMTNMLLGFETIYGNSKGVVSGLKNGAEILDRLQGEFKIIMNRFHIYSFREEIEFKHVGLVSF